MQLAQARALSQAGACSPRLLGCTLPQQAEPPAVLTIATPSDSWQQLHFSPALHCAVQRRCYWTLDGDDSLVLVHYLDVRDLNTMKARHTMVRRLDCSIA